MKYTSISLFTGAGGLDYGLETAGFQTSVAVEMDAKCCATLKHNRPNWPILNERIEKISTREILKTAGLKRREPDLLVGGPPCQPFSKSGYWINGDVKRLKDPRANTLRDYMRVLEETLPRAFLLENVFGLAYRGKDEGLQYIRRRLQEINRRNRTKYSFNWQVINAASFGVPQIRERVFIIGCREGRPFEFPTPRFLPPEQVKGMKSTYKVESYRTAWDALHDLEENEVTLSTAQMGGRWAKLLPTIPEGQNYLFHTEKGPGHPIFRWRSRYWSFLLKLAKDRPSWTIQAQPGSAIGPFHWDNRRLTMRELARLQTFPDDVDILGNRADVQKQIGNAVPSAIGEMLGLEIRRQFFLDKVASDRLKLIPKTAPKGPRRSRTLLVSRAKINRLLDL